MVPAEQAEPAEPVVPAEPAEPAEPVVPAEPAEPVEPGSSTRSAATPSTAEVPTVPRAPLAALGRSELADVANEAERLEWEEAEGAGGWMGASHRASDDGRGGSRPVRERRAAMSTAGRASILILLASVTVLAPVSAHARVSSLASASVSSASSAPAAPPEATAPPSSVAAAVLGSDADVDDSTDTELSNVPDAATLAKIRDARENAQATCAKTSSGAAGEAGAFNHAPEIFNPMMAGTYTVSSVYGYRIHPTLGYLKLHAGQDYSAPVGTPIYAVAAGTVVEAGMVGGTGMVIIQHEIDGETWYTSYLHMYPDGIYVSKGEKVTAGQLIAGVGSTGRSTGPHLHFEVRTANDYADESTVEPTAWLEDHEAAELTTDCN